MNEIQPEEALLKGHQDPRFARIYSDPRFHRHRAAKHASKIKIDSRFQQALLEDPEFVQPCIVDKYGRKINKSTKNIGKTKEMKELRRFYHLSDNEDEPVKEKIIDSRNNKGINKRYDPARGEGISSSTSSSSSSEMDDDEDIENGSHMHERNKRIFSSEEKDVSLLKNSFLESSADEDINLSTLPALEVSPPTIGKATNRLAIVNMDWDHIKATDIFHIMNSFKPALGKVLSVKIYTSDFGKQRLQDEELHGPPKEIFDIPNQNTTTKFKLNENSDHSTLEESINTEGIIDEDTEDRLSESNVVATDIEDEEHKEDLSEIENNDDDDSSSLEDNEDSTMPEEPTEFNEIRLRKYQLERLRYYYAVVECDSVKTASHIYQTCDGIEFEKSCNRFDIRYIPESITFIEEEKYLKEASLEAPLIYEPNEFTSHALQHSKVRLTWDDDDPGRVKMTKRRFTSDELENMDFKAYLASSSSEDELAETSDVSKVQQGDKYRELLKETDTFGSVFQRRSSKKQEVSSKNESESDIDLEVTFRPGLETLAKDLLLQKQRKENPETIFEKTLRKQREKQKQKKNQMTDDRDALLSPEQEKKDSFDTLTRTSTIISHSTKKDRSTRKKHKNVSHLNSDPKETAKLQLLMMDEQLDSKNHFSLKGILQNEKKKHKKKKKIHVESTSVAENEWEMNVDDPRFAAVYENSLYAIDPTNAAFKPTKGMQKILATRRKRIQSEPVMA